MTDTEEKQWRTELENAGESAIRAEINLRGETSVEKATAAQGSEWGRALQVSHPVCRKEFLMGLAKTYNQEATREDTEAGVRRRLR